MRFFESDGSYNEPMLNLHEFSGSMTYETNLGLETVDFSYSLLTGPEADEDLLEVAARALAQFIVEEKIDKGFESSHYSRN